jgi:Ca2+-binding EF-hand superfamily protein
MLISVSELARYGKEELTMSMIKRVMQGCGRPFRYGPNSEMMSYEDFIWFILSVEEKSTPQAIEYWFRCLDIDGDGVISLIELSHFYEDQYDRMLCSRGSDLWKFEDFVCSL